MQRLKKSEIVDRIKFLGENQSWNHCIELYEGIYTTIPSQISPGKNLVKWERMKSILEEMNLKNKCVLDIGSNDGYFSLKLAEMGAEVTAVEANKDRIEKARFVFETKGFSEKIRLMNSNIYELRMEEIGRFDLVLCMGFLHRVPDLYSVLEIITKLGNTVLLEFKALTEYAYDEPLTYFDGRRSVINDHYSTGYFIPSTNAVIKICNYLGLKYYGIIGDPKLRRVMLLASSENQLRYPRLKNISNIGRFFLIKKYTKRYLKDIYKSIFSLRIK